MRTHPEREPTTVTDQPTAALPAEEPEQRVVAGRYRLTGLLGRGGTAEVWRAEDEALGRSVALKLVTVPTDESAARAGDEARTLARLNHPSLVPVYDAGTDDAGHPWVVMELVEGETLSDTIRRGTLPSERAAVVGRSIAEALGYVHAQGLVHRDVKPGNVLVGTDGRVRLTDFGIARLVDAAKVTSTGMMVGTASYLAPEQVAGEPVGPPADVYALGLVLLECLTGRREYQGSTVEVALARLHRQPAVPADLPAGWPGLLAAMTAREPRDRPAPQEAARELATIAAGGQATTVISRPVAATSALPRTTAAPASTRVAPAPPAPADAAAAERQDANNWPWAIALVVVIALLAGGGYLYAQSQQEAAPTPLPAVNTELPDELRANLERLQQEVSE
jgi:eukaryotic-like serine/threonine-protein kinase